MVHNIQLKKLHHFCFLKIFNQQNSKYSMLNELLVYKISVLWKPHESCPLVLDGCVFGWGCVWWGNSFYFSSFLFDVLLLLLFHFHSHLHFILIFMSFIFSIVIVLLYLSSSFDCLFLFSFFFSFIIEARLQLQWKWNWNCIFLKFYSYLTQKKSEMFEIWNWNRSWNIIMKCSSGFHGSCRGQWVLTLNTLNVIFLWKFYK